jgi:hypothetical protein
MRLRGLALGLLLLSVGCAAAPAEEGTDGEDVAGSDEAFTTAEQRVARFKRVDGVELTADQRNDLLARYGEIAHDGVREPLFVKALQFYDTNLDEITNKRWLGIVDFQKHSSEHRFFVLDMEGGAMRSFLVAHGSGSDRDNDGVPTRFSNVPDSNMSSLGFYETAEVYTGVHGRSMRLDGLSATNRNARRRSIVIHAADYVREGAAKQGRSQGCLAVSNDVRPWIIANLESTIIYASN